MTAMKNIFSHPCVPCSGIAMLQKRGMWITPMLSAKAIRLAAIECQGHHPDAPDAPTPCQSEEISQRPRALNQNPRLMMTTA